MAQHTYKLARAQKELNEAARKHFGELELVCELPDTGASIDQLVEAAGSEENLRTTFISAARLARQKAVKIAADELGTKVEAGELTVDEAVQQLTDVYNSPAEVKLRGEGTVTRKPSGKQREVARQEVVAEQQNAALAILPGLSGKELRGAITLLEGMGVQVPEEYKNR